ncbi:hypothetical protein JIN85_17005 [Luteolibacter pohnpeiensis]|uniref:Uncharacterized protein n=1 Tax=Luteolibacter pohnpeiensis TaxID=454153 RepID=A0A934VW04_9BACT|nr:hypothetical protein [Luteolibacter pohnpeiensis]MBK1884122.1 hypothetical protein [Luteolibacter pohnpeiensis]
MPAIVPNPKQTTLFLPISSDAEFVVTVQVKTAGLGMIDPPTRRAPSAEELHLAAELLQRRVYQFHPSTD